MLILVKTITLIWLIVSHSFNVDFGQFHFKGRDLLDHFFFLYGVIYKFNYLNSWEIVYQ